MNTFIALFRGINVGGKNILPMKELAAVLKDIGLSNVKTYIQSGNVVFQSKTTAKKKFPQAIRNAIGKSHGFTPEVLILSIQELQDAIVANPFPEGENEPKSLHLFFLASTSHNPNFDRLEALRTNSERFKLINTVFYLYAPDGIGRSKLAANVQKALGVTLTARNWRSVNKIMAMAADLAG